MTDHVEDTRKALHVAGELMGDEEFAHADNAVKAAHVHATLALVDAVDRLTNSFGTCDHGYTICPHCIRFALEGPNG